MRGLFSTGRVWRFPQHRSFVSVLWIIACQAGPLFCEREAGKPEDLNFGYSLKV